MKRILLGIGLFLLLTLQALAQEFATHAVKAGETLYSIAKQYRVTPYNILKANKELKKDAPLQPNTILVIPLDAKAQGMEIRPSDMTRDGDLKISVTEALDKINDSTEVDVSREAVRFLGHRVHRKETLFGIAKQYGVTEENIKHYNPELYGSQLKKGMRLRIPVFAEPVAATGPDPENFEIHMVQAKETRWSIAHSYGITIDSLLTLNPELSPANNSLPIGQQLLLPKKPGSTVENQQVDLFVSYTVPPKMTLYSLSREFNVPQETIIKLNPEVVSENGLREGMVLRLPAKKATEMAVNTDNYVFYDVKPKQTTYSLTRNLGISYQELLALNPALANGLKAGMVLKIPKAEISDHEIRNSLILDKINLIDSIHTQYRPKLVFMLPFRLDRINFSDTENVGRTIENRNDIKYSLGLYSGALIALDSISRLGVSVDVATYDNDLNLAKTKEILRKESLEGVSAVFGPLDQPSMEEVAVQAGLLKIPVISPVPLASGISLNNVFFSYTSDDVLRKRMLGYMRKKVTDQNIIVIADGKNKAVKDTILATFPQARIVRVKEEEKNISVDLDQFTAMLSTEKENWAFVETDNYKLISSVTSILNSAITDSTQVRMFTTNKSKAFDNDVISGSHLSNLKFTYPSVYREAGSDAFVRRYKARFGSEPDRYAVRGFDLTFDLLLKLAYMPDLFDASGRIGATEYVGNKFDYARDIQSGYFNQATYIMMYDNMYVQQVKDDTL